MLEKLKPHIKENLEKEFEQNGRTAYALCNGINYYYNHQQGASNIKDESTRARIRMEQNYYGKNSLLIDRAKELCLALWVKILFHTIYPAQSGVFYCVFFECF